MTKGRPPASGRGGGSDVVRSPSLGARGERLARRGLHGSPDTPQTSAQRQEPRPAASGPDLSRCGKLIVSRERKGHGGKAATVVTGLGLAATALEHVA